MKETVHAALSMKEVLAALLGAACMWAWLVSGINFIATWPRSPASNHAFVWVHKPCGDLLADWGIGYTDGLRPMPIACVGWRQGEGFHVVRRAPGP